MHTVTAHELAEIPATVTNALATEYSAHGPNPLTDLRTDARQLHLAILTTVRAMRAIPPEIFDRAVGAAADRTGLPRPALRNALHAAAPVLLRELPDTGLVADLAALRGCMSDGYTAEQVTEVFDHLQLVTGSDLICVWNYVDDTGFGGDSQFYLRTPSGQLREINPEPWLWLNGDPANPATPVCPGEPSTWATADHEAITTTVQDGRNHARHDHRTR